MEKHCRSINEKDEQNKKKNRERKAKKKKRKDARDEPIMESCDFGDVEDELRGHSHNAPAQVDNIQLMYQPSLNAIAKSNVPPPSTAESGKAEDGTEIDELSLGDELDLFWFDSDDDSHVPIDSHENGLELIDEPADEPDLSEEEDSQCCTNSKAKEACVPQTDQEEEEWREMFQSERSSRDENPDDPYHPDMFEEDKMPFYPATSLKDRSRGLSTATLAQIDLLLILQNAGCPLYLYDTVVSWMKYYISMDKAGFTEWEILHREQLLKSLGKQFKLNHRKPTIVEVKLPSDHRLISLTKFSFVNEFLSILHDDDLMSDENFVEGYDIMTGMSKDKKDFWKEVSIKPDDLRAIPIPTDPKNPSHIYIVEQSFSSPGRGSVISLGTCRYLSFYSMTSPILIETVS